MQSQIIQHIRMFFSANIKENCNSKPAKVKPNLLALLTNKQL
jgi:hypothetical protein